MERQTEMEQLITDRTQEDSDYAFLNQHIRNLKGAYGANDYNRIGEWVNYLTSVLRYYGYYTGVSLREDWDIRELPTEEDHSKYINAIKSVRGALEVFVSTPRAPDSIKELMALNGWDRANDIERILRDVNIIISLIVKDFIYADEIESGESDWV